MRLSILISERMFSAFDIDRELTGVRAYKTVQYQLKSEKNEHFLYTCNSNGHFGPWWDTESH